MKNVWIVATLGSGLVLLVPQARAQTYTRTDAIAYEDNLASWVLGQQKSSSNVDTGRVESQTDYDPATALPVRTYAFGKRQRTLGYYADGTLATLADGNNNVTTFSSWKRGIPQAIRHPATAEAPAGAVESAVVNDKGWLDSVTDPGGAKTCYGYDAMGRLASITYPSETQSGVCNASTWAPTSRSVVTVAAAEYGIPAGHWRQTVSTGNARKVTYYDALWRPLVGEQFDNSNVTSTRSVGVTHYDAGGHAAYQSYPLSALTSYATVTLGTRTTYDGLDRITRVEQDSELGVLASTWTYQSGFKTRVVNPRGYQTITSYQAYDQPTTDWPVLIDHPEGTYTDIVRDAFGKPISITRRNAAGSISQQRRYFYNAYQELCRVIEPETGGNLMGYDPAGNLAWSAAGLSQSTACNAAGDTTEIRARKVVRQYDTRNRITTLRFPDGLGDQDWRYTADGLPEQIVTYNGPGHTQVVTNAYAYNRRRLLAGESSTYADDGSTWDVGYGYDASAHLASQTYPDGRVAQYAPNALGQATQVDSGGSNPEAWGASYYPNGALKQFTYGNGIVHTLLQNARGLPERSTDAYGTTKFLDDSYDYDPNGNVAAITDGATSRNQRGNRDMGYDGLDRLTAVASPMYGSTGAAYAYDALDNLTRVRLPDRNYYYCYDAGNRLTNIKIGGCDGTTVTGLGYDVQGNLANRSGTQYAFDFGSRLRRASYNAATVEAYRYDGHGRRVLATSVDGAIASFYSQAGQLLYQDNRRDGNTHGYYYLAGSLVDELTRDTATGAYANCYQHTDALGSPVAVTNGPRTVLERSEYEPYGKLLNRPLADGPGYAGHVSDAATGLSYMQQRYYDPRIGRFLSVDPVTANANTGGNFNRYWYADNNPYTFQDPDGRATCADKNCEKSTIDSTLVRPGLLPPAVNGNEGLSNMEVGLREMRVVSVTFQNDDPSRPSTDKPIETSAANMVEKAVLDAGVQSININSSTGGHGGKQSWHNSGHAVDINRVNGVKVSSNNSAATRIQEAARAGGRVRENFGPNIMEKTSISGGVPVQNFGTAGLKKEHQNHVHLSVQPSE